MKKIKLILLIFIISFGMIISCNEAESDNNLKIEKTEKSQNIQKGKAEKDSIKDKKKQVSKYICPNRCEEGNSEKPGNCPSCQMELIENLQ